MRAFIAACLLVCAAACVDPVGPAETMSLADARAAVSTAVQNQGFCTEDGHLAFRRAVRAYAAAYEREAGENAFPLAVDGPADETTTLITMGVLARVVQPSDLRGPAAAALMALDYPGASISGFTQSRDALALACPELVAALRAGLELQRVYARLERLEAREERSAQS
ncbi:MAG: hypothetical protein AB7G05_13670, partial [Hyphomonadaceae bacterium]